MTAPAPPLPGGIVRVPWDVFLRDHFRWEQGEHVSCVGPTGCGKSTLQFGLLPLRRYTAVLGTKPKDPTLDRLIREQGYRRVKRFRDAPLARKDKPSRLIVWPPFTGPESFDVQREVFADAFARMFREGGWAVCADEVWYLCKRLGLTDWLETYWTQARSLDISLLGGTQRPAHVPLFMYDAATHLFLWRDNDETNLRRVGGIGGLSADVIRATVATLPRHDALYVNTRDGRMVVTRYAA